MPQNMAIASGITIYTPTAPHPLSTLLVHACSTKSIFSSQFLTSLGSLYLRHGISENGMKQNEIWSPNQTTRPLKMATNSMLNTDFKTLFWCILYMYITERTNVHVLGWKCLIKGYASLWGHIQPVTIHKIVYFITLIWSLFFLQNWQLYMHTSLN